MHHCDSLRLWGPSYSCICLRPGVFLSHVSAHKPPEPPHKESSRETIETAMYYSVATPELHGHSWRSLGVSARHKPAGNNIIQAVGVAKYVHVVFVLLVSCGLGVDVRAGSVSLQRRIHRVCTYIRSRLTSSVSVFARSMWSQQTRVPHEENNLLFGFRFRSFP